MSGYYFMLMTAIKRDDQENMQFPVFFFFLTAPILEALRNSNKKFVVCLRELRILLNFNFCDF